MAKKFIAILIMITMAITPSVVYASNSVDDLDNRVETESAAGITWDEINEMSQNSPNSLTPIQGLVLWMFAILAFLKLAQKMDSLLQSLGLNVTQTGGRAVGDLVMAGMALKHVGGAISKGVGMFGFGGKGGGGSGGSPAGAGSGGASAGSTAPTPIPTSSSRTGTTPAGSTPSPASPSTPPSGSSPSASTPSATSGSGTPSGASSPSPATATTPTTPTAENPSTPTGERSPVGKAVDWMKSDGFAQGAVKAGAKGGLIGLGTYTAKAGASKVGDMVSAHMNGDGISPNPQEGMQDDKSKIQGGHTDKNPEEYQVSKPLDGTEDTAAIPTSFNSDTYQDTTPTEESDGMGDDYSSINTEEYSSVSPTDTTLDTQPIPTTSGDDVQDETNGLSQEDLPSDVNNEAWQDTTPVAAAPAPSAPIPTDINNESWNSSSQTGEQPPAPAAKTIEPPVSQQPQAANPSAISSEQKGEIASTNNVETSIKQDTMAVQNSSISTQSDTAVASVVSSSQVQQSSDPPQQGANAVQAEKASTVSGTGNENAAPPVAAADSDSSGTQATGSVENVSVSDTLNTPNPTSDTSSENISQGGSGNDTGDAENYESAPMPVHNQAISSELPQGISADAAQAAPIADINGINGASDIQTPETAPISTGIGSETTTPIGVTPPDPSQAHVESKIISADVSSVTQTKETTAITNDHSPLVQTNTTVQSQNTQVNNDTRKETTNQNQPISQAVIVEKQGNNPQQPTQSTAIKADASARPTAKAKTKNTSGNGRKRRR